MKSEVRAKKALGQHFLVDLNIARKICDSLSGGTDDAPDKVLEVGPGMGVLTRFLLQRNDVEVHAAEIDSESVVYLQSHYPQLGDRLVEGDFLKMDLRKMFPGGVRVIGNFPYNISSQIFFKVLEYRDLIPECVGMIQKEVAVRLAEGPGSKEYGILSVLLQAWYDIEYLLRLTKRSSIRRQRSKVLLFVCAATRWSGSIAMSGSSCGWSRPRSISAARCCVIHCGLLSVILAERSILSFRNGRATFGRGFCGTDPLGGGPHCIPREKNGRFPC